MGMIKHFQVTQNNKFALCFQYLKKKKKKGMESVSQKKKKKVRNGVIFGL